ncbi:A24 family peptidase [Streptomyces sp. TRM 70351]|uniref:A24 family peptidase n=1 Tax=Streptomyces sp. TRM 70351 TaxID=3116552 RepID=UPI002E7AC243|nr:A24 family peptidase [Streptomyces sp. TRM 70351]MEE1927792.1 A24 family peptidase [Streptomyces sp. TRM 70351]
MAELLVVAAAAAYGAAAGPLTARPAFRLSVPEDAPRADRCPGGHPLPGWLGPGRCRPCGGTAYGPSGRLLALLTAAVCAGLAAGAGPRPELVVWLLLTPALVLLAAVDRSVHRLPDAVTLPLAAAAPALLGLAALLPEAAGSWPGALLGGAVLGVAYFVLFLINPRGMGFGDVKLAVTCGTALGWYGWGVVLWGTFAAFVLAAAYGWGLVLLGRARRTSALPFGPFMVFGTLAALTAGGLAV